MSIGEGGLVEQANVHDALLGDEVVDDGFDEADLVCAEGVSFSRTDG